MNLDFGYFATLIGGNKYREYEVYRDDELIAQIVRLAEDFWHQYVLARSCPPVDGSDACSKLLNRLYPEAKSSTVIPLEETSLIETYFDSKRQIKMLESTIAEIENLFKSLLGEHEIGVVGPYKLKWGNRTRNGVDSKRLKESYPEVYGDCMKQTQYRQFSIKQEVKTDESSLADAV
ncbi:hypothetical protein DX902_00025 [Paenibacillus jamilae]|uniref:hypothetical protein n=1 Tax=Paenibacillus TaxID=44249 RepID=UPI000E3D62A8|nr:hypothetical protein [Paenibacillus jamilae]RFT99988.1 hypothetical protein DX902_00025 [Paenibacillus jamilae]